MKILLKSELPLFLFLILVFLYIIRCYATNYDDIVPKTNNYKIIVVSMKQCSGCQKIKPVIKELKDAGYNITLVEGFEYLDKYNVKSVPTLILFKGTKEISRKVGILSKKEIISWVNNYKKAG